tara:strand:- start:173 stop:397 length:225 start_codon:yes stop_codon:yes gene_type:complete
MKLEIIKGVTVIIAFLNNIIGVVALTSYYIPHPDFMLLSETVNSLPVTWVLFISSAVFFYLALVWLWIPKILLD